MALLTDGMILLIIFAVLTDSGELCRISKQDQDFGVERFAGGKTHLLQTVYDEV